MRAVRDGDAEAVRTALLTDIDPNRTDGDDTTPLQVAVAAKRADIVELLVGLLGVKGPPAHLNTQRWLAARKTISIVLRGPLLLAFVCISVLLCSCASIRMRLFLGVHSCARRMRPLKCHVLYNAARPRRYPHRPCRTNRKWAAGL